MLTWIKLKVNISTMKLRHGLIQRSPRGWKNGMLYIMQGIDVKWEKETLVKSCMCVRKRCVCLNPHFYFMFYRFWFAFMSWLVFCEVLLNMYNCSVLSFMDSVFIDFFSHWGAASVFLHIEETQRNISIHLVNLYNTHFSSSFVFSANQRGQICLSGCL